MTPDAATNEPRLAPLRLLAGGGAGLLLALAFPPFDLPLPGLLGVPVLLALVQRSGLLSRGLVGLSAGIAFFAVVLSWIGRFGWYALAALVLVQASFLAAFAVVAPWTGRPRGPVLRALAVAGAWAALEWLRGAVPFGGFPWATLGSALHGVAPARRLAAWVGASGLSALLVAASALVLQLLPAAMPGAGDGRAAQPPPHRGLGPDRARCLLALGALLALLAAAAMLVRPGGGERVRVAVVQAGIEASWRNPADPLLVLRRHVEVTRRLAGEGLDLVLWGENVVEGGAPPDVVAQLSEEIGIPLAAGAVEEATPSRWRNLVVAAQPGRGETGRYAKRRPVPFGEYVPARPILGRLAVLAREVPRDMLRGDAPAVFRYPFGPTAPVISYESAFPALARSARAAGARMLQVHTNNASYGRSAASEQHLALDQMRTAELGVPVVRAAITGISALIDAGGDVVARMEVFETGVLRGTVELGGEETPYARLGDWTLAHPLALLALLVTTRHLAGGSRASA